MSFLGIDFWGLRAKEQVEALRVQNEVLCELLDKSCTLLQANQIELPPELAEWKKQYDRNQFAIALYLRTIEKMIGIGLINKRVVELM